MNKKLILIIALLVIILAALTLLKKDTVMAPQQETQQPEQTEVVDDAETVDLNFSEEDRIFCTETGCELLSCATGTIEDIEVPEGEVPVKCSDDSELVKQPF